MLYPVDKEKSTQQPSLHGHRAPSSPKQPQPGKRMKQKNPGELKCCQSICSTPPDRSSPGSGSWDWDSVWDSWREGMVLVELSWVAAAKKGLKETSSLAQKRDCPWQQQPKRCYRILQSLEINKPARLPCTALTQRTCPRQLSWQPGQKKLQPPLQSHRENRGAPCACSLSFKGTPDHLHEPGVKHTSSSSSSWVLKGQWSSWSDWCREDMEHNTHFWGYQGQKDSNLLRDFWK